ncbi:unnamed protein product [Penicillium salamii]|uniref:Tyrosinase C-terminal domain-containing protein n=1 Tax=Penicillium salamii TaxID=1612424 RepID=A0A9W4JN63_9EURO|nr:unnamed protein product [Penicillium salamii]CAG8241443.1 unnamed protein product [Penicillium salamii]CAG8404086.1 unnamed protein product [Penicillium salamii]
MFDSKVALIFLGTVDNPESNIDRLTAIWQSLNWEKWFDDRFSQKAKDNLLTPFHKDTDGTFWKSDDVREWQKLGYDYEILKGRGHANEHRQEILDDIKSLYGRHVETRLDKLPKGPHGENDDYVITVVYDKFALNGAPYKINLFLDETEASSDEKFRGPESEGFVASIYNFSGSLSSSPCGNCEKQKSEGVKCVAQVPATIPMRSYRSRKGGNPDHKLQPVYLAWNNFGTSVKMDIEVAMHRSSRAYYHYPTRPEHGDPLKYDHVATGRQSSLAGTSFR